MAQTMEGGLDEITSMLQRIRTLAVQASNGINTGDDKAALSQEANSLLSEINRIAKQTTYGGKTILTGYNDTAKTIFSSGDSVSGSITFQIGANSGDTIAFTMNSYVLTSLLKRHSISDAATANSAGMIKGTPSNFSDLNYYFAFSETDTGNNVTYASNAIAAIDTLIKDVDEQRSSLGALQNRLESSIRVQSNVATNESDARSRIRDTDFAEESANLSQQSIIQQAATSMLMQANARPQIGLSLLG